MTPLKNRRVLVVDDNRTIHDDFRKILGVDVVPAKARLADLGAMMFGDPSPAPATPVYEMTSAYQGEEAFRLVQEARKDQPFALAFVDMRMPPGWDGVKTIQNLWEVDPRLQVVICSAHSDYSWEMLIERFGAIDRLLLLKKPFDTSEVSQLACALTEKWHLARAAELRVSGLRAMVEEQTAQIHHDALHDRLTGLPNRRMLADRLEHCLASRRRRPGHRFALLFMDLDRFKMVNDSLGHALGDKLLIEMARRLSASVRSTDTLALVESNELVRFGGDEFVLLLEGLAHQADALRVADRIQRTVCETLILDGHTIHPSISIGIAFDQPSYERPDEMLRDANVALSKAKAGGPGTHEIFSAGMHAETLSRWKMEGDLRRAIERGGELVLDDQPIVSLDSGREHHLEALVRWIHPERGFTSPGEFIPIAEATGLVIPLGLWVLEEGCRQIQAWNDVTLSINVSGKQFAHPTFVKDVKAILERTGVDPRRIRLEITESALMETGAAMLEVLAGLRELDLKMHMDDFGTGYSSLSYLHRMPVDAVKIDRSFIAAMVDDPASATIVKSIIALAKALDLQVIAEGIETQAQRDMIRALGCDAAQGYLFAKPMAAAAMSDRIEARAR